MTNKFMELADQYAETTALFPTHHNATFQAECAKSRNALATEVQAHIDAARAALGEDRAN